MLTFDLKTIFTLKPEEHVKSKWFGAQKPKQFYFHTRCMEILLSLSNFNHSNSLWCKIIIFKTNKRKKK